MCHLNKCLTLFNNIFKRNPNESWISNQFPVVLGHAPQFSPSRDQTANSNVWNRPAVKLQRANAPAQGFPSSVALWKGWWPRPDLVLQEKQKPEFNVIFPICKVLTNKITNWAKIRSGHSQKRKPKRTINFWEGEFIFLGNQDKEHYNNNGHSITSDLRLAQESSRESSHSPLVMV